MNEESESIIVENLEIFEDFVQSGQYEEMSVICKSDPLVCKFLEDITLRYNSIKFYIVNDIDRAVQESHVLASLICDYLGYE